MGKDMPTIYNVEITRLSLIPYKKQAFLKLWEKGDSDSIRMI